MKVNSFHLRVFHPCATAALGRKLKIIQLKTSCTQTLTHLHPRLLLIQVSSIFRNCSHLVYRYELSAPVHTVALVTAGLQRWECRWSQFFWEKMKHSPLQSDLCLDVKVGRSCLTLVMSRLLPNKHLLIKKMTLPSLTLLLSIWS